MTIKKPATVTNQAEWEARKAVHSAEDKASEADKKNGNFLQLEKRNMTNMRGLISTAPKAAELLLLLSEHMNRQNAVVISMKTLMQILNWSRPTISEAVRTLSVDRWIQVVKIGTANAYIINSSVFWQSARNLKLASFSAQIVANADEQVVHPDKEGDVVLRHLPHVEVRETKKRGSHLINNGDEVQHDQSEMYAFN